MAHALAWCARRRRPSRAVADPSPCSCPTRPQVLGGKHMVPRVAVSVLGEPPFHATHLTSSGALAYVGGNWERDIAFAGYAIPLAVSSTAALCCIHAPRAPCPLPHTRTSLLCRAVPPLQGDFPASKMLNSIPGVDPARRDRLVDVLDIDPAWRMHLVSDGQRRRVQIAMGLLKPFDVRGCRGPPPAARAGPRQYQSARGPLCSLACACLAATRPSPSPLHPTPLPTALCSAAGAAAG